MSISKHHQHLQIELPQDDPTYLVDIDVDFNWIGENYGEDADGNRGMWVEYPELDTYQVKQVQKYDENMELSLHDLTPEIKTMVEVYMDKWEPEQPEDDRDDEEPPDRDR